MLTLLPPAGNVWTDVDAARTGNLPFVFETDMSFEKYVEYAMDVPMYFVYRNGKYINALGQSWREFMEVREVATRKATAARLDLQFLAVAMVCNELQACMCGSRSIHHHFLHMSCCPCIRTACMNVLRWCCIQLPGLVSHEMPHA